MKEFAEFNSEEVPRSTRLLIWKFECEPNAQQTGNCRDKIMSESVEKEELSK